MINKDILIYEINPITYLRIHKTNTAKNNFTHYSTYLKLINKLVNINNNRINNKLMRSYLIKMAF